MLTINTTATADDIGVICLEGRLAGQAPEEFKAKVSECLSLTPQLVVDCSQLNYIDSTGLGSLLASLRMALSVNGDLRLAAVQKRLQAFIELVRADQVFSVYSSCDDALDSYRDPNRGE